MHISLQRRLGLPLSVLANTKAGDRFGDLAVNSEQLSTHHAFTLHAWFLAIRTVHGASAVREPPPALHSAYSLDARPDCVVLNTTPTHHHELFELKVASPIATGNAPVPAAGSLYAFGNTEPRLLQTILGRPSPHALEAKYHDALHRGHTVTPLIMETLGGMAGHACLLLRRAGDWPSFVMRVSFLTH
eukprot:865635-Pleurochrysis_carterae.AAC.2